MNITPLHLACAAVAAGFTWSAQAATPNTDWPLIGMNAEQQHYSPLTQINDKSVKQLGLAWSVDMPTKDGATGVPLIADGVIYQSGALGKVFAHDVRTGKMLWSFDAQIQFPRQLISAWGARLTRGLALWEDKVITATGDCRLIALDRKTGKKLWESQACDPDASKTITGAPRVGGGKVFIGNSNADSGVGRGHVDAFDANTGKKLWRFYTIPGDPAQGHENAAMAKAAKTWGKDYWKNTGGGSAWDALTYDPKTKLLYLGTDGPAPFNPLVRGEGRGDELYTNSIVAVNAETGAYVWHYQTTPEDGWNYGATMHIMMADLPIRQKTRRVVMTAPKNGFYYVLDAYTGKLISAQHYVPTNWASHIDLKTGRPVTLPDARYWEKGEKGALVTPSPMGAHNWQPMSYSPRTGLVYIPAMEMTAHMKIDASNAVGAVDIDFYYGLSHKETPYQGSLIAWDPVQQKQRWKHNVGNPYNGGVLSTAGNVVFQGTTNGDFVAYRADTGERLWSMPVGSAIFAAPSTVIIDGEQLVIVPIGSGTTSSVGFASRLSGNLAGTARLLAFKLNGKATLNITPPTAQPFPEPPQPRPATALVAQGLKVWNQNACELCHGFVAAGAPGSSVPDLRRSTAETHELFAGIVLGGLRKDKGMPLFNESINMDDLGALQAYVLNQAWDAFDAQTKAGVKAPKP